jgi:hypothetical protein
MGDLGKLRALGAEERRLLALCLVAIPWVVIGLRLFGFRRMRAFLGRKAGANRPARTWTSKTAAARARVVARIAGLAAGRGPVRATCLRRSMLVWWLLRREGIDATVRIGVRRDGAELRAHAWVEHRGTPIDEGDDPRIEFTPFDPVFDAAIETRR